MDTATASPRPWRVEENAFGIYIVAADGRKAAQALTRTANAALIVEAVNGYDDSKAKAESEKRWADEYFAQAQKMEAERDRLRDMVRRLAETLQSILDAAEGRGEGRLDESLIREARAAIGEDRQ